VSGTFGGWYLYEVTSLTLDPDGGGGAQTGSVAIAATAPVAGSVVEADGVLSEPSDEFTFNGQSYLFQDSTGSGFIATGPGLGATSYYFSTDPNLAGTTVTYQQSGNLDLVCFAAGTRILTVTGEVPVEALRQGERVVTLGRRGPPLSRVLWIGRRRVRLAGRRGAAELAPVRIAAGALAPNTPRRDLLVSGDHCLHIDGVLVPARLLVNGTTIAPLRGLAEVVWYHVELDRHDVLIADGAAAESWLDCGNRAWFANAGTALLTVEATPDRYASAAPIPCAPVLHAGPTLAAIRDAIALRAVAIAGDRQERRAG
jgi:hypothetical protein